MNWQAKHSISFFTSMINIFNFKCVDPETSDYYYLANWPTWNNSPDCPYNKKLSCLRLIYYFTKFYKNQVKRGSFILTTALFKKRKLVFLWSACLFLSIIEFIDFWSASQIFRTIFHRVLTHLLLINYI